MSYERIRFSPVKEVEELVGDDVFADEGSGRVVGDLLSSCSSADQHWVLASHRPR